MIAQSVADPIFKPAHLKPIDLRAAWHKRVINVVHRPVLFTIPPIMCRDALTALGFAHHLVIRTDQPQIRCRCNHLGMIDPPTWLVPKDVVVQITAHHAWPARQKIAVLGQPAPQRPQRVFSNVTAVGILRLNRQQVKLHCARHNHGQHKIQRREKRLRAL
jgi:hypothetical protein